MSKNFFQNGKWVDGPGKPAVLTCVCGNKYIKTREAQTVCVRCLVRLRGERLPRP